MTIEKKKTLILNDYERGFLTALIDGEGAIGIRSQGKNRNAMPIVSIANTSKPLLDYVHTLIEDTSVCSFRQSVDKRNPKWKKMYYLNIKGSRNVQPILEEIKDGLIVKKQQAKLALSVCKSVNSRKHNNIKERGLTIRDMETVECVLKLNKKGV
jgi:hypothetical protein